MAASRAAWQAATALAALSTALFGAGVVQLWVTSPDRVAGAALLVPALTAFGVWAGVGWLITTRRPDNALGWLIGVAALSVALSTVGDGLVSHGREGFIWLRGLGLAGRC